MRPPQFYLWLLHLALFLFFLHSVSNAGLETPGGVTSDLRLRSGRRKQLADGETTSQDAAVINGHIILGGLFPVHSKGLSVFDPCGTIQFDRGIQRLEAMLFAIDAINNDETVLSDVTLGANILDTCSRDTYALEQSLEYVRASLSNLDTGTYKCDDGSDAERTDVSFPVAGVVGGSYSTVSIQVANLFRLFRIPQVSYASTSVTLSDKSRFDYFARTVPPDNFQAKAMADIVRYFNWTYVSTVASQGNYGERGIDSFRYEARARNICLAVQQKIEQSATEEDLDEIINELLEKRSARVVILFLRVEDAKALLSAAKRQGVTNHFIWLASDGWGKQDIPVNNNQLAAEGALTLELQAAALKPFDEYFMSLRPETNTRNPWFREFWEKLKHCRLPYNLSVPYERPSQPCTGSEHITPSEYQQESKIQFVYDAVYAMAHALDMMTKDACGHLKRKSKRKRCIKELNIDGARLYKEYLLNVTFEGKFS